jgi:uncharacterized protein (DUF2336 family)
MDDLPAAVRLGLAQKLSDTLTQLVTARDWLAPDRARRIADEAMERSTVNIAAQTRGEDLAALVTHLRSIGQLNAGLILRALLSGNIELFEDRWSICRDCRAAVWRQSFTTEAAQA